MAAEGLVLGLLESTNRPYNVQARPAARAGAGPQRERKGVASLPPPAFARSFVSAPVPAFRPSLQLVSDMLATKGVKKAGAEKALEALVEKGKVVSDRRRAAGLVMTGRRARPFELCSDSVCTACFPQRA